MRTLDFKVDRQKLHKLPGCDFSEIVAGSVGYLCAKFHFSEEWNKCTKVASFFDEKNNEYSVLLDSEDSCMIPGEAPVGATFTVKLTGARGANYIIRTDPMKVKQEVK